MEDLLKTLDLRNKETKETKEKDEYFYSFETFIKILKSFILNQKEKDYLDRILNEVEENEKLEN